MDTLKTGSFGVSHLGGREPAASSGSFGARGRPDRFAPSGSGAEDRPAGSGCGGGGGGGGGPKGGFKGAPPGGPGGAVPVLQNLNL
mmetsp:Transcript_34180/g.106112  ORF Transcript_34180/g.106112 Transcript_34180/m.106112 type:complete len:86 (-) Transcript_34180:109-366(-)